MKTVAEYTEHGLLTSVPPSLNILTLLLLLGADHVMASEEMNSILAQVATNTKTRKHSGNTIQYDKRKISEENDELSGSLF